MDPGSEQVRHGRDDARVRGEHAPGAAGATSAAERDGAGGHTNRVRSRGVAFTVQTPGGQMMQVVVPPTSTGGDTVAIQPVAPQATAMT